MSSQRGHGWAREIERDNLNELITVAEDEHGPVTGEETQASRDRAPRRDAIRRARSGCRMPRGTRSPAAISSWTAKCLAKAVLRDLTVIA